MKMKRGAISFCVVLVGSTLSWACTSVDPPDPPMHSCTADHDANWSQYAGLKLDHTESRTCTADFNSNDLVETSAVIWYDAANYPSPVFNSVRLDMCDEFYYGSGPQDWACLFPLAAARFEFFGWEYCAQSTGFCEEVFIDVEYYAGDSPDRGLFTVTPWDAFANEPRAVLDITFAAEDDPGGGEGG